MNDPYEVPYAKLPQEIRDIVEAVCANSPAQFEAFRLYLDARAQYPQRGWSYVADCTGKTKATVKGYYDDVVRKLIKAGVEQDMNRAWHLTDRKDTAA